MSLIYSWSFYRTRLQTESHTQFMLTEFKLLTKYNWSVIYDNASALLCWMFLYLAKHCAHTGIFFMLMFVWVMLRSGAENWLPVIIALCVLYVWRLWCVSQMKKSVWTLLSAAIREARGAELKRAITIGQNVKPSCKTKVHNRVFEPDEGVLNRLQEECALCVLNVGVVV